MNRLQLMLDMQRDLQLRINKGRKFDDFTSTELMAAVRDNVLALTDELHEAMNETGWKPWASSNHINRDAYLSELVDAFHFFMNLMLLADIKATEFFEAYVSKNAVNHKRQDNGYDGVKGKCPHCHRDLQDKGVECYEDINASREIVRENWFWCNRAKNWFTTQGDLVA